MSVNIRVGLLFESIRTITGSLPLTTTVTLCEQDEFVRLTENTGVESRNLAFDTKPAALFWNTGTMGRFMFG